MILTEENKKKLASKEWRMNNLYKIVNEHGELMTFKLRREQDSFMRNRTNRNIILKARQLGFTTLACIDFLDDCLFNQNLTAVIIAHKQDQLEVIFRRVQIAWENFQKDFGESLGFKADASRTNLLKFNTGSLIRVALSSRGDTVQRLHVSEFGKICAQYPLKAEEILTGAFPSVPTDGRITIESTAEGETGYFADMFWEAWNNKSAPHSKQFKAFFFPWYFEQKYRVEDTNINVPQMYRGINLKQYQVLHNLDESQMRWYYLTFKEQRDKMKQEYPTTPEEAFEASEDKFFDVSVIQLHKKNYAEDGEIIGGWTFYEKYNPMHIYVLGSDPAEGIGRDSSVAHVIDCSYRYNGRIMPKVVAVFEDNKMPPDMFAHELKRIGIMYGNALIGVERNGNGIATIAELKQHYYNLYMETRKTKLQDIQTERIGFATTSGSKSMVLYNLATALREDDIIVPDVPTLDELRRYDTRHLKSIRFDPDMTNHLDRVMSLAIAYEMVNHVGTVEYIYDEASAAPFDPHAGISI